jgi:type II secretory pathway component PulM
VLSAITLAVVLAIAVRPAPEPIDNTPAVLQRIDDLQAEFALVQQNVTDLRTLVEAGGDPAAGSQMAERLDRIEASVAAVAAKVQAICGAIQSSPFAPSGFACP